MSQLQVTGEAKIRDIQGPVVANDGVITALDGAANQYVRGDGTLANFPTSGGGGSSVSYYLNGSVNQGTFGGSTYYQMSKNAITGAGTNFSRSSDGLIAQFITDANDPDVVSIPSGNWNLEFFMNVSASSGAFASFYVEFYKYDGSTFTLLATNVATPEQLTNTTTIDAYFTSVAMPLSAMAVTDRLAVRIFVNVASKTVTLYTEDNRLCQIITTFSNGLTSLNNLTDQSQYLTTGTSGTNFNIDSSGDTHTFNLPIASATNTGKLSSSDWSIFNNKVPYTGANADVDLGFYSLFAKTLIANGNSSSSGSLHLKQNDTINVAGVNYGTIATNTLEQFVFYWENASFAKRFNLDFSALTPLGTPKTFTLPNASGTLALTSDIPSLAGYVPYTGATGNVDLGTNDLTARYLNAKEIYINKNGSLGGALFIETGTGYGVTGINGVAIASGSANNLIFNFIDATATNNKSAILNFGSISDNVNRTFTLPDASGTLALTSNLASYVPYTGATANVDLGVRGLLAAAIIIGQTSTQGYIHFKTGGPTALSADTSQAPYGTNGMIYSFDQTGGNYKQFVIDSSSLTNNTIRTYTMPNASGTIALTSDLGDFVTLSTYQTITANKTFSGWIQANTLFLNNSSSISSATGFGTLTYNKSGSLSTFRITNDNNATASLIFDNTTNYNYTFPSSSGTLALISDLGGYVTLSTTQTITGAKTFSAATVFSSTTSHTGTATFGSGSPTAIDGSDGRIITNKFRLYNNTPATIYNDFVSAATTNRSITVPDASGTMALTTDLSAYLPLSGGTLTGALNGTSASFSSSVAIGGATSPPTSGLKVLGGIISETSIGVSNVEGAVSANYFTTYSGGSTPLGFIYGSGGVIWSNAGTKMSLTSAGALQVVGSLTAASLSNGTNNYTFPSANGTLVLGTGTNNYISKFTSTGSTLGNSGIFDNGTNVIFGGTSNTSANPTVVMQNRLGTVLSVAGFNWAGTTTDNNSVNSLMVIGGYLNTSAQTVATATNASGMQFFNGGFYWYGNSGLTIGSVYTNTQRMFLTVGGNLIIGSGADAGFRLDVSGTARLTGALTATSGTFSSTLTMSAYSYADSALQFRRANSDSVTPASGNGILIFGGGTSQIRIGTDNSFNIDVNNSGSPINALKIQQGGNTLFGGYVVTNSGLFSSTFGIYIIPQSGYWNFNGAGITGLGQVGTGTLYSNGGTVTTINPSDSSLKNTIKDYQYGLNEILKLIPKTFYYNSDIQKSSLKYGFIAQDIESIMPDAVRKLNPEDKDSKLGLEIDAIYVAMVNAIKELKAEIDILKNK